MLTIRSDRLADLGLARGSRVLDVGTGFGRHAYELARRGMRVVALDVAPDEIEGTRDTLTAMVEAGEIGAEQFVGVLRGDATRLPFADATFDAVITSEVLEHVPDDTGALAEMVRVLTPGGVFAATVPSWLPEKINWMLSDEYHAPAVPGGHVRIYSATELKAKVRAAGLRLAGTHHAHALHTPYWWLKCAVGVTDADHPLVSRYRRFLEWDIVSQPRCDAGRRTRAVAGARQEPRAVRGQAERDAPVTNVPELPGLLSAEEVRVTAEHLASLQQPSGLIPWFPGGHCDPWNHVESAMALDIAGLHHEAEDAYEWLAAIQRDDGSWHNYYWPDGSVEESKLDTNVCAYIATGVWHHWRCTWDRGFLDHLWPTVERALDWVLAQRRADGLALWAIEADGTRQWSYALLTGTSCIQHALRCGHALAEAIGEARPDWLQAAELMTIAVADRPEAFEPKDRWAMDWYYPVLSGALTGEAAKARLAEGWDVFAMEGCGIRCVSDEPWVTASETAECALAFAAIGDRATASDLLRWTRAHRRDDGSYWTGLVYDAKGGSVRFPFEEHTSYTAAAVILAADAIAGASPASALFTPRPLLD